jgi:hypothetical protein
MSQRVVRDRNGPPVAEAIVRGLLARRNGGTVAISEMLEIAGNPAFPEPMPPWILDWAQALDGRRQEVTLAAQKARGKAA